jgi:hypothetical protein
MRRPRLLLTAIAALAASPTAAQERGTVRGVVLAPEAGVPLGLSVVPLPALGVERFADAEGRRREPAAGAARGAAAHRRR